MVFNPLKTTVWMSFPKTAVDSGKFPASGESDGERQKLRKIGEENKLEWVKGGGVLLLLLCCRYLL